MTATEPSHGDRYERCPVTGARVLSRPEWSNVSLDRGYSLTVGVIGGAIVHSRPSGYASLDGAKRAMGLIGEIVDETIGGERPYVHVGQYSSLRGASVEARRYYSNFMKERERDGGTLGVVLYGASPLVRIAVKLGRRLHLARPSVELVSDYAEAVTCAVAMLQRAVPGFELEAPGDDGHPGPATGKGFPSGDLELRLDGLTVRYEVLGDGVVGAVANGSLEVEHVGPIFELKRRLAELLGPASGPRSMVIDMTDVVGTTLAARSRFLDKARLWYPATGFGLLVFYGAARMLRAAIRLAQPFMPIKVRLASDLEHALELVRVDCDRRDGEAVDRHGGDDQAGDETSRHVDDLLRFLGNIDWEKEGLSERGCRYDAGHPLTPVFDAIELIKAEVDQLFEERRRTAAALRKSDDLQRTIIENIVDGYYEVDLAGNMVLFNETVHEVLGVPLEELTGLNYRAFMDEENAGRVFATFNRVFRTGQPARLLDWELRRRDGSAAIVEASVTLVRDADGEPAGFRGMVRDVSERVKAEQEASKLQTQLLHAQRMEAIGTLAGGIAHNFNNLLMGIQGNVSFMAMETDADHPHYRRLKTIEALVQSGSKLTAQLLGYARVGRYEARHIDLNQLVRDTSETFTLTRKDIRVHLSLDDGLQLVKADRGQIEQVLLNLFINAADAMPRGGDLELETRLVTHEVLDGKSYAVRAGRYVCLSVRDTGAGMDARTASRVFEPFFTTKGMSDGTGLGLSSAYGIVKAHDGYIDVESEVGSGSDFLVFLPASEGPDTSAEDCGPKIVHGRGKILVVEDDEAVLEAVTSMLEFLEYSPVQASTGRQAVVTFKDAAGDFDLVILDMILPDMGGGEVFDALRSVNPEVKVLLASGYSVEGEAARILDRGCDDFIQKPFSVEQLSRKLSSVFGGG